jgi:hypothetical protein
MYSDLHESLGRVIAQAVSRWLLTAADQVHQLLHNHPHLSSGAGTIDQKWPQYKGLSPTPLAIKNTRKLTSPVRSEVSTTVTAYNIVHCD